MILYQYDKNSWKKCMRLPKINKSTITIIRLVLIFISVVIRFVSVELTGRSVKTSNNRLTRTVCSRRVDVVLPVDL